MHESLSCNTTQPNKSSNTSSNIFSSSIFHSRPTLKTDVMNGSHVNPNSVNGNHSLPIIVINRHPDAGTFAVVSQLVRQLTPWDVKRLPGLGSRAEDEFFLARSPDTFNTCYVFEDCIIDNMEGLVIMEMYIEMAKKRRCPLIVINLVCLPRPKPGQNVPPLMWKNRNGLFWTDLNLSARSLNATAELIAGHTRIECNDRWYCS
ncbi:hypothetical protein FPOAC2_10191 [Fusarium poae]|uniref:Uncharacterized protein n=1 Tax=Fusarium poae TaxID=36050 RepID=A0A1B8ARA2_FUSPO|nr:hypothetical protein FPOAC1_007406 [Fusarium poae]KAG8668045.1 hypothetical protein FPOAC1_007406 [Fusarium poae]OBS23020.1 hypothetical protein FPOA_09339 [Fusarium poae]